jgi:hypothetical protein
MPDMLVKLYELPSFEADRERLVGAGIVCRRAESYERRHVVTFVTKHWPNWADEVTAAFAHVPPTLFVAARAGQAIGFAAYNATRPARRLR